MNPSESQQHSYRKEITVSKNQIARPPSAPTSSTLRGTGVGTGDYYSFDRDYRKNNNIINNNNDDDNNNNNNTPREIARNPRRTLLSKQPRPQGVLALKELMKTRPSSATSSSKSKKKSDGAFSSGDEDDEVLYDHAIDGAEADTSHRVVRGGAAGYTPQNFGSSSNKRIIVSSEQDQQQRRAESSDAPHHHKSSSKQPKGPSIYDLSLMSPRAVIDSATEASEASQFTILLQPFKNTAMQGKASMFVNTVGGLVVNTGHRENPSSVSSNHHHHPKNAGSNAESDHNNNNSNNSSNNNISHLGTVSGAHPLHARFSVDRGAPAGTILGATAKIVCPQDEANFVVFVHDTQSKTTLSVNMNVLLKEERRASVQKDMQELRDSLELAKRHSDDLRAQLARTASERDKALDRIRDVEIDVQRLTADRNRLSTKERALEADADRLRDMEQRLIQQRGREDEQEQEMQQARSREKDAIRQRETERQLERQQEVERAREREAERKSIEAERARMNAERIQYAKDRQAFTVFMKQVDTERAAFQEREQQWRNSVQSAMSDVAVCEACVSRKELEKNVEVAIQRVKEMEIERDKMANELKRVVDAEASRLSSALSLGHKIPRNFSLIAGSCESVFPLAQAQLSFRGAVHRGRIFIFIQPKKISRQQASLLYLHRQVTSSILESQQRKNQQHQAPLVDQFEDSMNPDEENKKHIKKTTTFTTDENQTLTVDDYSKMKCLIGIRGINSSHAITSISPILPSSATSPAGGNMSSNNSSKPTSGINFGGTNPFHSVFEDEMLDFDLTSQSQWLSSSGSTSINTYYNESEAPPKLLRLSVEPLPGSYCHAPNPRATNVSSPTNQQQNKNKSFSLENSHHQQHDNNVDEDFASYHQNNIATSLRDLAKRVLNGWNNMKKRQELLGQIQISDTTGSNSNNNTDLTPRSPMLQPSSSSVSKTSFAQKQQQQQRSNSIDENISKNNNNNNINNKNNVPSAASSQIPSAEFDSLIKRCRYLQGWAIGSGFGSHPNALLLNATPLLEHVIPEGSQVLCFELAPGGTLAASGVSHLLKHITMIAYHQQTVISKPSREVLDDMILKNKISAEINNKSEKNNNLFTLIDDASAASPDHPGSPFASTARGNSSNNNNTDYSSSPDCSLESIGLHVPPPPIEMKIRFATCLEVTDEVDTVAHPLERVEEINASVLPAPPSLITSHLWDAKSQSALMKSVARGFSRNILYDARSERVAIERKMTSFDSANSTSPAANSGGRRTIASCFSPAVFPFCGGDEINNNTVDGSSKSANNNNSNGNNEEGKHPFQETQLYIDKIVNVMSDREAAVEGAATTTSTPHELSNIADNSQGLLKRDISDTSQQLESDEFANNSSFSKILQEQQMQKNLKQQNSSSSSKKSKSATQVVTSPDLVLQDLEHKSRRFRYMQIQLRGDGNKNNGGGGGTVGDITIAPTNFDRLKGHIFISVLRESDSVILRKRVGRVISGTIDGVTYDDRGPKRSKSTLRNWGKLKTATSLAGGMLAKSASAAGMMQNNSFDMALEDTLAQSMSGSLRLAATNNNSSNPLNRRASIKYIRGVAGEKTAIDTENGDFEDIRMIVIEFDNDVDGDRDVENDGGEKHRAGRYLSSVEMEQLRDAIGFSVCNFDEIVAKQFDDQQLQQQQQQAAIKQDSSKSGAGGIKAIAKKSATAGSGQQNNNANKSNSDDYGIRTGNRLLHVTFAGVSLFDPYKLYQQHQLQVLKHVNKKLLSTGNSPADDYEDVISNEGNKNKNGPFHGFGDHDNMEDDDESHVQSCSVDDIEFLSNNNNDNDYGDDQQVDEASRRSPSDNHHTILYPRPIRVSFGANVAVTNSRGSLAVVPGPLAATFRSGLRCNNGVVSKTPASGSFLLPRFSLQRLLPSSPLPASLQVSMACVALDQLFFDTSAVSSSSTSGFSSPSIVIVPNTLCVDGELRCVVFYNKCQIGIVETQRDEKLVVHLNGMATAGAVQAIVRCFAFRAGSASSDGTASLQRHVNVEMSIFGRTQWSDTIHLTSCSPLISFPFDVPLSRTEGDSVAEPLFNVPTAISNTTSPPPSSSLYSPPPTTSTTLTPPSYQPMISIPPELETLTNRSALAILVDIMPNNNNNINPSSSSSLPLPVQINMSRQALLNSGLVLKTCRASSSNWPQQWLKRIAATATLQQCDDDAGWMRDRLSTLSGPNSSSSSTNNNNNNSTSSNNSPNAQVVECFDIAASPSVGSFASDDDALVVESKTGLNRVASIAFVGTGTLLMVFPSAAANWLDDSLEELARQGILPVDMDSPPLVKSSHIQGALRSISAAVYSSLASASQCICSIRVLSEGNAPTSSAGPASSMKRQDLLNAGVDGDHDASASSANGSASFFTAPCTESEYEKRSLEAHQILRSGGSVVPRGRAIPMALHSFSSLLYVHAASTLTSIGNVDAWARGRFSAPPNPFGKAMLAPNAQLVQAPLSWSRGLVNISVHIESPIPNGLEPVIVIHNEAGYLGNCPLTMNNPMNNNSNNLANTSFSGGANNRNITSGTLFQRSDSTPREKPWLKLGVVRAVPEWETLLKLSKHSPKIFSVVSKNDLFGIDASSLMTENNEFDDDDYDEDDGDDDEEGNQGQNNGDNQSENSDDENDTILQGRQRGRISSPPNKSKKNKKDKNRVDDGEADHDELDCDAKRRNFRALMKMDSQQALESANNENFNILCFNGRCVGTVFTNNFYDEPAPQRKTIINSAGQQKSSPNSPSPPGASSSPAFGHFAKQDEIIDTMEETPLPAPPTQTRQRTGSVSLSKNPSLKVAPVVSSHQQGRRPSLGKDTNNSGAIGSPGVGSLRLVSASQQQQQASASTVAPLFVATMTNLGAMEVSNFISSLQLVLRPSASTNPSNEAFAFEKFSVLPNPTAVRISVSCKPPSSDATWSVDLHATTKVMWHAPPLVFDSGEPVPRYLFAKIPPSMQSSLGFQLNPFALLGKRCHVANFGLMNVAAVNNPQSLDVGEATLPFGTSVTIETLPTIQQAQQQQNENLGSFVMSAPSKIECSFDLNAATSDMGSSRNAFSLVPHADSLVAGNAGNNTTSSSSKSASPTTTTSSGPLRQGAVYSGRVCIAEYDNTGGHCMSLAQHRGNLKTKMLTSILRSAIVSIEVGSSSSSAFNKDNNNNAVNKDGTNSASPTSGAAAGGRRRSLTKTDLLATGLSAASGGGGGGASSSSSSSTARLQLLPSSTTVCVTFRDRNVGVIDSYFIELFWPGPINPPLGCPFTFLSIPRRRLQIASPQVVAAAAQNNFTVAAPSFVLIGAQEPCRVGTDIFVAWASSSSAQSNAPSGASSPQVGARNGQNNGDGFDSPNDGTTSTNNATLTRLPKIYVEWTSNSVTSVILVNNSNVNNNNNNSNNVSSSASVSSQQQLNNVPNNQGPSSTAWVNSLEKGISLKDLSFAETKYGSSSKNNLRSNDHHQDINRMSSSFSSEEQQLEFENFMRNQFKAVQHQYAADHGLFALRKKKPSKKNKNTNQGKSKTPTSTTSRPTSASSNSKGFVAFGNNAENNHDQDDEDDNDDENDDDEYELAPNINMNNNNQQKPRRNPHFIHRVQRILLSTFRKDSIRNSLLSSTSTNFGNNNNSNNSTSPNINDASSPASNVVQTKVASSATAPLPFTQLPTHWNWNWRSTIKGKDGDDDDQETKDSAAASHAMNIERYLYLETGNIQPEPCTEPIARIVRDSQSKLVLVIDEIELASLIAFLVDLNVIRSPDFDSNSLVDLPLASRVVRLFISSLIESFFVLVSAEARPAGTGDAFANPNGATTSLAAQDHALESMLRNIGHFSFGVIWDHHQSASSASPKSNLRRDNDNNNSGASSTTALCKRDILADITADPQGAAECFGLVAAKKSSAMTGASTSNPLLDANMKSTSLQSKANSKISSLFASQINEIFLKKFSWDAPLVTPFSNSPMSKLGGSCDLSKKLPNFLNGSITVKFAFTLLCKDPVARQKQLAIALEEQQFALDEFRSGETRADQAKTMLRRRSTLAGLGLLSLTDFGNMSATQRPGHMLMALQNRDQVKTFNVAHTMNVASQLYPMPHLLLRWGFVNELDDPDDQASALQDMNALEIKRAAPSWSGATFSGQSLLAMGSHQQGAATSQQQQQDYMESATASSDQGSSPQTTGLLTLGSSVALATSTSSEASGTSQGSVWMSNLAKPWDEVMALHTLNCESAGVGGVFHDLSAGFADDEDSEFWSTQNEKIQFAQSQLQSSTKKANNAHSSTMLSPSNWNAQIDGNSNGGIRTTTCPEFFSLPLSSVSLSSNNNAGSFLTAPLFVISQPVSAKIVGAARYRVRTSSHLRSVLSQSALSMATAATQLQNNNNSNSYYGSNSNNQNFGRFGAGDYSYGSTMQPNNSNTANGGLIQSIVKTQQQCDAELVVVFKDGYKVSRKSLERLIGRVAVFSNSNVGNNAISSSESDNGTGGLVNSYHLFCACTVVDRTTDTILAKIENNNEPAVVHL